MARQNVPSGQRIIVALDTPDLKQAQELVRVLHPHVGGFKVGLEFITMVIGKIIRDGDSSEFQTSLSALFATIGKKLMWDGKFYDIPNTMGGAAEALANVEPWAFTVHASSGQNSLEATVARRHQSLVLAVTVLTSLDNGDTHTIFGNSVPNTVSNLAELAVRNGVDGLVCSPQELMMLRRNPLIADKILVVPGIRPSWTAPNDQQRFMGPKEAIEAGADHLVIGRPITQPPSGMSPLDAVQRILEEIEA